MPIERDDHQARASGRRLWLRHRQCVVRPHRWARQLVVRMRACRRRLSCRNQPLQRRHTGVQAGDRRIGGVRTLLQRRNTRVSS